MIPPIRNVANSSVLTLLVFFPEHNVEELVQNILRETKSTLFLNFPSIICLLESTLEGCTGHCTHNPGRTQLDVLFDQWIKHTRGMLTHTCARIWNLFLKLDYYLSYFFKFLLFLLVCEFFPRFALLIYLTFLCRRAKRRIQSWPTETSLFLFPPRRRVLWISERRRSPAPAAWCTIAHRPVAQARYASLLCSTSHVSYVAQQYY